MSDSVDLFYTNEPHAEEIHHLIEIGMLIPVGEDDGSEAYANIGQAVDRWRTWDALGGTDNEAQ